MSDELAEMRAELAALRLEVAAKKSSDANDHLNQMAASARREAGQELALKADRNANLGGVSESARNAANILMEHDPLFWQMAQKAKAND